MDIPIGMLYSYQAGEKAIEGHFPVYMPDALYESVQTKSSKTNIELNKQLLDESSRIPVLAPTSTEFDPVQFILKKDGIEYNLLK